MEEEEEDCWLVPFPLLGSSSGRVGRRPGISRGCPVVGLPLVFIGAFLVLGAGGIDLNSRGHEESDGRVKACRCLKVEVGMIKETDGERLSELVEVDVAREEIGGRGG